MTDPVWSVNIMFGIGMIGVAVWIYYILNKANKEMEE